MTTEERSQEVIRLGIVLALLSAGLVLWFWTFFRAITAVDRAYLYHVATDRLFACSLEADVDNINARDYLIPFRQGLRFWRFSGDFDELGTVQSRLAEEERRRSRSFDEIRREIDQIVKESEARLQEAEARLKALEATEEPMARWLASYEEGTVLWSGGSYFVRARGAAVHDIVPDGLSFLADSQFPAEDVLFVDAVRFGTRVPDRALVTEQLDGCLLIRGDAFFAINSAGIGR